MAAEKFFHTTSGMVHCLVEKIWDGVHSVTLVAGSTQACIQESLLKDGTCRISKRECKPSEQLAGVVLSQWKKAQEDARRSRTKLWRYGDNFEDSDEDAYQRW
jgi:hypothetical protein